VKFFELLLEQIREEEPFSGALRRSHREGEIDAESKHLYTSHKGEDFPRPRRATLTAHRRLPLTGRRARRAGAGRGRPGRHVRRGAVRWLLPSRSLDAGRFQTRRGVVRRSVLHLFYAVHVLVCVRGRARASLRRAALRRGHPLEGPFLGLPPLEVKVPPLGGLSPALGQLLLAEALILNRVRGPEEPPPDAGRPRILRRLPTLVPARARHVQPLDEPQVLPALIGHAGSLVCLTCLNGKKRMPLARASRLH